MLDRLVLRPLTTASLGHHRQSSRCHLQRHRVAVARSYSCTPPAAATYARRCQPQQHGFPPACAAATAVAAASPAAPDNSCKKHRKAIHRLHHAGQRLAVIRSSGHSALHKSNSSFDSNTSSSSSSSDSSASIPRQHFPAGAVSMAANIHSHQNGSSRLAEVELDGAKAPVASTSGAAGEGEEFLCGVAISVYQNSGGPDSNWSRFEHAKNWLGKPRIAHGDRCGVSSDFWNNFAADIQRAADLNVRFFRFSLEWARLEPEQGCFDPAAVARYHEIFDCLKSHGMVPMVTLYHFVHPGWFDDLGQFEQEDNIDLFVRFSEQCFREYHGKCRLWATINEANVVAFCGYVYGSFPPAHIAHIDEAGRLLLNLFKAHAAVYDALKALPGGSIAQVGIVHNQMRYEPKNQDDCSSLYVRPITDWLYSIWSTDKLLEFFKTGKYEWRSTFWSKPIRYTAPHKPGTDFVGLNYYGTAVIGWKLQQTSRTGQMMTDMLFPTDPGGLYHAIQLMASLGKPVYITETGIADHTGRKRSQFFREYFVQIEKAVADGYDVRGLLYWTLVDNFEWAYGFGHKFGLYEWDPKDPSQQRRLLPSSRELADIYKTMPAHIGHLRRDMPLKRASQVAAHSPANSDASASEAPLIQAMEPLIK